MAAQTDRLSAIKNELNNVVQFERFAFVRIDTVNGVVLAYYTHP